MEDRIHRRDVGEERLRRADVRGGLFAADVLLSRLQRHAIGALAARIDRHPDDPARRLANVAVARRQERRVWPAVSKRHPEPLRVADDGVGAHFAGGNEEGEREQVGRDRDEASGVVRASDQRSQIARLAVRVGVLRQDAERAVQHVLRHVGEIADDQLDFQRRRAAAQHVDRLREAPLRDDEDAFLAGRGLLRLQPVEHRHRFGRSRPLVQERRRRDVHPRQVPHHRLKIQERFEAALGDLGLVRGVGGVPAGVLEHVAENHRGRDAVVVAVPDVGPEDAVARGDAAQAAQVLVLRDAGRKVERRRQPDVGRNGLLDQSVERRHADGGEHLVARGRIGSDMSRLKAAGVSAVGIGAVLQIGVLADWL